MKKILAILLLMAAVSFGFRLDAQIAISEDMFGRTSFTVKAQVLDAGAYRVRFGVSQAS